MLDINFLNKGDFLTYNVASSKNGLNEGFLALWYFLTSKFSLSFSEPGKLVTYKMKV